jgi:hydrogenase expression/formation protein HypC
MCLAIPGRIVEFDTVRPQLAMVEVAGARRQVNIDLLRDDPLEAGDWVLIHVGFAMSKISEEGAQEQMRMLAMMGEDAQAMEEIQGYRFGQEEPDTDAEAEPAAAAPLGDLR